MLPRWHIFWGLIFTGIIWLSSPSIEYYYLIILFLSTVLLDIDHYINAAYKEKNLSLRKAFSYYSRLNKRIKFQELKGIRKKEDFHPLHTVEFHLVIAILAYFFTPFIFVFLGIVFHSLLDLFSLIYRRRIYLREYFLIFWIYKKSFK